MKWATRLFFFAVLLLCASCGYRLAGPPDSEEVTTLTVPYVQGDSEGQFTDALSKALSSSGAYQVVQNGGSLTLKAAIISSGQDRIGFRYDRKETTGKLEKNLLPSESRRTVVAEVTLIDTCTEEIVLGPSKVTACAEYDYVNPDSVLDLIFFDPDGTKESTIAFSLGQLDSIEGAHDDASIVIYRVLAQKIVDGMMNAR
jgi:hypothetical protein